MKVILQKTVPNLGDAGDIKEVASGFAVNYLIPQKLVIPATPGASKAWAHQEKIIAKKTAARLKEMQELFVQLKEFSLTLLVKAGRKGKLFGSITAVDISKALEAKNLPIEKRKIEIPRPIRETGSHKVVIKLAPSLVAEIKVEVQADEASIAEIAQLEAEEEARAAARKLAAEQQAEAEAAGEGSPV